MDQHSEDPLLVDVAIIGAGTAGLNARREALRQGARVVLIESGPYGTTCARVGCMPSKLLIHAGHVAHEVRGAGRFGVTAGAPRVDGRAVLERVRRERDRFVGFVLDDVERIPADEKLLGLARFVAPTSLEVGGRRVEARAIVIATGSSDRIPHVLDGAGTRLVGSADLFELPDLPRSVGVIGAGVVGLELGQALHRLGVQVGFYSLLPHAGPLTDPVVQAKADAILGAELELHLGVSVVFAREEPDGVLLRWREPDGSEHDARYEWLLAAAGRRPNVTGLNLAASGLPLADDGVPFYDPRTMQCGDAPVFIAGDAADHRPVLHEAADDGRIAGRNAALWPAVRAHVRRAPLSIVFCDPQLAMVGRTWAEVRDGGEYGVGQVLWDDQGRSRVMGVNRGVLRVYGDPTSGTLLGAEMVGPDAEHIAHLLAWVIHQKMNVVDTLQLPFYHPVVEEGLRSALRDLARDLKLVAAPEPTCLECPGA
jgi:dihydrolipoamide dehydrogenase